MYRRLTAAASVATLTATGAFAQTEVTWWHAMGGELGEKLEEIVAGYNESQDEFTVTPVYKGTYTETMTAATRISPKAVDKIMVRKRTLDCVSCVSLTELDKTIRRWQIFLVPGLSLCPAPAA